VQIDYSIALKIILAAILGGAIGLEREFRDKPAGLRTNMLICIGTTLFMIVSINAAKVFGDNPTRIAAQIVTGIGFLGAGAVLHSHGFVVGLTTAATIWVVAGIGMAVGSGFYGTAIFTTVLSLITLMVLPYIENRVPNIRIYNYSVTVSDLTRGLSALQSLLAELSVPTTNLNFRRDDPKSRIWFTISAVRETNDHIIARLSSLPEVKEVDATPSSHAFPQQALDKPK
jgi:putative Mg2+ transporter-C (MgtC) family protein